MEKLIEKLKKLNTLPMHMPGHKRNNALFSELSGADIDITEIDGFDNLHNAQGILKKSMQRCADLKGADRAFYLVNGSTCGILAAVYAVVSNGDTVICARNCHKSVYNALELVGADTHFVMPDMVSELGCYGKISTDSIASAIAQNSDAKLIIVTSPTYEGIVSDIKGICKIAHEKNIPVMVDAAHGAHLGYSDGFLKSATECGADIAVESLHKTMPSLTQTAVCYVKSTIVDKAEIEKSLSVFETSSPSYILLSSIDSCVNLIADSTNIFDEWQKNLDSFYTKTRALKTLKIYSDGDNFDKSKIVIYGASGIEITQKLRQNGIETEMTAPCYTICMTGAGDTKDSISRLADTLLKIDKDIKPLSADIIYPSIPKRIYNAQEVRKMQKISIEIEKSAGKTSADYLFAYPPGIPIVIPGEELSADICALFLKYKDSGVEIVGQKQGKILVVNT